MQEFNINTYDSLISITSAITIYIQVILELGNRLMTFVSLSYNQNLDLRFK